MAEINKPDYTYLWSSGGSNVAPSNTKIQTGWTAEVPPFQWENWSQNRQDQAIAHMNQYGIPVWDAVTEYRWAINGTKSLVMGSNGITYRAKQINTNRDPVTDVAQDYWEVAFPNFSTFIGSNQSLTPNGYQKLPGGFIIQWGSVTTTTNPAGTTVTLPVSFPAACVSVVATATNTTIYADAMEIIGSLNTNNFTVACVSSGASGVSSVVATTARWIAIGY